ncbi:MAG: hypothetical protein AAF399_27980, partial [Bacteroidota bacterium]
MAGQIPPLYGRFEFPNVEEFLRRLRQVSAAYMGLAEFSAYLTTHDKESFYGLDYEELGQTILEQEGLIRSIASSCSGDEGRSVNVNVRFPKKNSPGEAQFVIVTPSRFESQQISQMLLGTWEEKSAEVQEREESISNLLRWLLDQVEERANKRREEAAQRRREEAAKLAAAAKAAKAAQAKKKRTITTVRDKFHFDDNLPAEHLIKLLENISHRFLGNAPFNIRLITRDGQPYSNIGLKGLLRFFEKRRSMVLKLFMDAATPDGELVDLMLAFGPMARHLNAEVEITTRHTKEIQTLIRKSLEHNRAYVETDGTSMVHEMFRFEQSLFSLDRVIKIVNAVSNKYLGKEPPTAFLSTQRGETYPSLDMSQARKIYQRYRGQVSFLLFGVNHSLSGRTFSLNQRGLGGIGGFAWGEIGTDGSYLQLMDVDQNGHLGVLGNISVADAFVRNNLSVTGSLNADNVTFRGDLQVDGNISYTGELEISGRNLGILDAERFRGGVGELDLMHVVGNPTGTDPLVGHPQGAYVAWNVNPGTGRTTFANQIGQGANGGFEWREYNENSTYHFGQPIMQLGRDGHLSVLGSFQADGSINANSTVSGHDMNARGNLQVDGTVNSNFGMTAQDFHARGLETADVGMTVEG